MDRKPIQFASPEIYFIYPSFLSKMGSKLRKDNRRVRIGGARKLDWFGFFKERPGEKRLKTAVSIYACPNRNTKCLFHGKIPQLLMRRCQAKRRPHIKQGQKRMPHILIQGQKHRPHILIQSQKRRPHTNTRSKR